MSRALDEIGRLLALPYLSKSDILNLLTQFRVLIETTERKGQYPYLSLYCDWVVHTEISRSPTCYAMLERLTEAMLKYNSIRDGLFYEINEIIAIEGLRNEITALMNDHSLPTRHFEEESLWNDIYAVIVTILIDRPLRFPSPITSPKVRAVYDRIEQKSTGTDLAVRSFAFALYDGRLYWELTTAKPGVSVVGPLLKERVKPDSDEAKKARDNVPGHIRLMRKADFLASFEPPDAVQEKK